MTDNYTSQNAFHDWDKTASVRCRPKRILLSEHIEDKYFFPPEFAPFKNRYGKRPFDKTDNVLKQRAEAESNDSASAL